MRHLIIVSSVLVGCAETAPLTELSPAPLVRGQVVDAQGRGAPDVAVFAASATRVAQTRTVTDRDGFFVFTTLSPGPWWFVANRGAGVGAVEGVVTVDGGAQEIGAMILGPISEVPEVVTFRGVGFEERVTVGLSALSSVVHHPITDTVYGVRALGDPKRYEVVSIDLRSGEETLFFRVPDSERLSTVTIQVLGTNLLVAARSPAYEVRDYYLLEIHGAFVEEENAADLDRWVATEQGARHLAVSGRELSVTDFDVSTGARTERRFPLGRDCGRLHDLDPQSAFVFANAEPRRSCGNGPWIVLRVDLATGDVREVGPWQSSDGGALDPASGRWIQPVRFGPRAVSLVEVETGRARVIELPQPLGVTERLGLGFDHEGAEGALVWTREDEDDGVFFERATEGVVSVRDVLADHGLRGPLRIAQLDPNGPAVGGVRLVIETDGETRFVYSRKAPVGGAVAASGCSLPFGGAEPDVQLCRPGLAGSQLHRADGALRTHFSQSVEGVLRPILDDAIYYTMEDPLGGEAQLFRIAREPLVN